MSNELAGKVALVTGASKNIGKGIALEVGASGAVTYLTARSVEDVPGQLASLNRTVAEIQARGGTAVAVACDHTDDAQVEAVFNRIREGRAASTSSSASPPRTSRDGGRFLLGHPVQVHQMRVSTSARVRLPWRLRSRRR